MPRFVLLYHDCPADCARPSHWDLMLEEGDSLRTWALVALPGRWAGARKLTQQAYSHCPMAAAGDEVAAEQLGAHRRAYLEFEGPLSGERGTVIRVATGTYVSESEAPTSWQLSLTGDNVSGRIVLARSNPSDRQWRLECLPAD